MNAKLVASVAILAAAVSGIARADEADGSQFALKFEGGRTRAEVKAEAAQVPTTRSSEPAGSRVAPLLKSGVDVQTVRAQAREAVRLGQISHGEASM